MPCPFITFQETVVFYPDTLGRVSFRWDLFRKHFASNVYCRIKYLRLCGICKWNRAHLANWCTNPTSLSILTMCWSQQQLKYQYLSWELTDREKEQHSIDLTSEFLHGFYIYIWKSYQYLTASFPELRFIKWEAHAVVVFVLPKRQMYSSHKKSHRVKQLLCIVLASQKVIY